MALGNGSDAYLLGSITRQKGKAPASASAFILGFVFQKLSPCWLLTVRGLLQIKLRPQPTKQNVYPGVAFGNGRTKSTRPLEANPGDHKRIVVLRELNDVSHI
jgi:hypothetical protein